MLDAKPIAGRAANGLVLCLVCLLAAPAPDATAQSACVAAPDYSCLIGYAHATAEGIEDLRRRAGALKDIAAVQAKAGDRQGARATLEVALAALAALDNGFARDQDLVRIAPMQAKAGDPEGARATAGKIEDAKFRGRAFWLVAKAQTEAGDFEGALVSAKRIERPHVKARALAHVAAAQAKAGDLSLSLSRHRREDRGSS